MENEDFQCTSTNYPLDNKNAVRLADFDKSIKRAGESQEIRDDLEVISTVGLLFYLSASFFHLLPYFLWPIRGCYYHNQKGKNFQAVSLSSEPSLPCKQQLVPGLVWSLLLLWFLFESLWSSLSIS